ncbi:MAG: type II secretion system protein GspL [Phycisphaerae bacterium]
MNEQGCLGIYLTRDKAVAVCLDMGQASANVTACFEAAVEPGKEHGGFAELADKISQACTKNNLQFSRVAVALDSSMYMQHDVHSSFSDKKQVETTVRFDTEEALATDISDVSLAYGILSSDQNGSALRVFTSQKNTLTQVINALAANGLDPADIEPDVICLGRFFRTQYLDSNQLTEGTLFAALSESNGYLVGPLSRDSDTSQMQRTFLIATGQDRNELLTRNISLSAARLSSDVKPDKILLMDSTGSLQKEKISSALGMQTELIEPALPEGCKGKVSFAAAFGAALSNLQKDPHTSFRNDFMPYLGKKRRLEKTLKIVSISASVIIIAIGLNLTLTLMQKNRPLNQIRNKFEQDYLAAMPEKEKLPSSLTTAKRDLEKSLNRIERIRSGQISASGEQSVTARLTEVLRAFNEVAAPTKLNIEKISVTSRNVTMNGDTNSRSDTLKLLEELKKEMNVQQSNLGPKGGRDTFSITAVPKTDG